MFPKRFLHLALALAASLTALQAAPRGAATLYRVHLDADGAAHRLAVQHQWPVYDLSGQDLLVGADVSAAVGSKGDVTMVYQGELSALRWVTVRRGADPAVVAPRALYAAGDRYLLRAADVPAGLADKPESYWVKPFRTAAIKLAGDSTVINPAIVYDPAIAAIANQVDSSRIRAWVTAMQNFGTRHVSAGNHVTVTNWVKDQFAGMGISDVVTDTCYGTTGHNVIATIPGLYDTVTLYIAGGHYDSYAVSNAPGADDNASGAAAALEYAHILSQAGNRPNSTVKLICFDAEEIGLYGSEHVSARMAAAGATIGCMLNFDMVGADGNDSAFYSQHNPGSTAYAQFLIRMARLYGRHADTNAVGQYGAQYLSQSDSYPFAQEGFPVAWTLEKNFSTVYHTANDNTSHMNFRYLTGNLKGSLGFFATIAFHPAKVRNVKVSENGSGSTLAVSWGSAAAANIAGYKVYWGRSSGSYADYHTVTGAADTTDTITGLMADSLYYVAVAAVDDQGRESVFLSELQARPFNGTAATAFFDDFESGLSLWTRSGTPNWDTTGASYHSPGHSVTDSRSGNYGNNVNSYLQVLDGIDLTGYTHASLSWWERYATESGWDFCRPEYSINNGAWTALVAAYSGSSTSWKQRTFDLTGICPTTTSYRFRFRFTTDGNTVDDGWYVDDVLLTGYVPTGVTGSPAAPVTAGRLHLQCRPSPAATAVELVFSLPAAGPARLDVYDIAGRRVVSLGDGMRVAGEHRVRWDCRDAAGRRVANGTYFFRLAAGGAACVGKVSVVR
ncbi:MAG: M20/M25/M40 family metallo-hydrolase [Candidatus Edwardsbacteria bacterium]|jgi:hypothetical protein|nr:M20/M25/M40 family metallo-hydrolase [Candidatus Edwardsbacteria bacterium]